MTEDVVESDPTVEAFRRFLKFLPHGRDLELVILKAHLLIEEQIWHLLTERVHNPEALRRANLSAAQKINLAQSFFPVDHDPGLWKSLQTLNTMRNDIAHTIESKKLQDSIADFINAFSFELPPALQGQDRFELTLWVLFVSVADLIQKPTAAVLEVDSLRET
jgi:hypothetical protein